MSNSQRHRWRSSSNWKRSLCHSSSSGWLSLTVQRSSSIRDRQKHAYSNGNTHFWKNNRRLQAKKFAQHSNSVNFKYRGSSSHTLVLLDVAPEVWQMPLRNEVAARLCSSPRVRYPRLNVTKNRTSLRPNLLFATQVMLVGLKKLLLLMELSLVL